MRYTLTILTLWMIGCCYEDNKSIQKLNTITCNHDTLRMIFIGDIMQHMPQIESAYDPESGEYNYSECFDMMAPYWHKADIVAGNLETTLHDKEFSGYPTFCAPYKLADDLKKSGVTLLVTANNHSLDKGRQGLIRTIRYLDKIGLKHAGTAIDSTSYKAAIIQKRGFRVAILNYTYGTNGINIPEGVVVPLIDTLSIKKDIQHLKQEYRPTNIVVFIHWGEEYQLHPSKKQILIGEMLEREGVDIIIGSHPHVAQTMIYQNNKKGVIVYSLGNFISNQSAPFTNTGISALVEITNNAEYKLSYINHIVEKGFTNERLRYRVIPECQKDSILDTNTKEMFNKHITHMNNIIDTTISSVDNYF